MFRGLGLLKVKPLQGLGFRPMAQAFAGKPFKGLGFSGLSVSRAFGFSVLGSRFWVMRGLAAQNLKN